MVQRKAPTKISSQAETKRRHVKLERQASSQKHQDTRNKGGGERGGGDLKKKMKLERSIRAAELESLQNSPMKPKKRSPNYMKPTSSSDARKELLQVKLCPENSKSLNCLNPKSLNRQSSLKGVRPLMNKATCSSTLKDSKFPQYLDLNPEGISMMRVCPYTYCSLNGHRHEPLPPLRSFMKTRRKLIKTQKSMKLKGLPSLKVKGLGKGKGEVDTGQKAIAPSMEEITDDFFLEIFIGRSEDKEDDQTKETYEDTIVGDLLDKRSELSNEEVDVMMSFLEYVECDQKVDYAEEEKKSSFVSKDNGELHDEGYDGMTNANEESTFDFNCEEEVDNPFSDNITESSESHDDCLGLMPPHIESSIKEVNQESVNGDQCVVDEDDAEFEQEVYHKVVDVNDAMTHDGDNFEGNDKGEELCRVDVLNQELSENDEELVSEESYEFSKAEYALLKFSNENIKKEENENDASKYVSISSDINRYSYTRKKITDEQDEIREFNPQAPNFLDLEPDPEAEKVDLKHQIMDERKNSEEYLIDHALQRAVTKLGPNRKKKVALLVEAFETVMPFEKPLRHETSSFIYGRIMQACS